MTQQPVSATRLTPGTSGGQVYTDLSGIPQAPDLGPTPVPPLPPNTTIPGTGGPDPRPAAGQQGTVAPGEPVPSQQGGQPEVAPAVPVPDDAYQVTEDIVISDNLVAVTKAGTVVDTKADGTMISLADGTRVTVAKDGTVTLDPNFRNPGSVIDENTMHGPGTYISPDGTQVQILDGKVVITDPNGEKLTVYPNGSCKIDVPEPKLPEPPKPPEPAQPEEPAEPEKPQTPQPGGGGSPGGGGGGEKPETPGGGGGSGGPTSGGGGGGQNSGGGNNGGGGGGDNGGGDNGGGGGDNGGGDNGGGDTKKKKESEDHKKSEEEDRKKREEEHRRRKEEEDKKKPPIGHDIKVTPGDLLKDSQYFSTQSGNAATLSGSFRDVSALIKEYGLWFGVKGPYMNACKQFATLYDGGSKQMTEISGALQKSAAAYKSNEDKGEELAEGIF